MKPKGFTLIEIITVISIFALLLGLVLANLNRGKSSQQLRETSLQLVDHLREMQNDTLTGKTERACHKYLNNNTLEDRSDDTLEEVLEDCGTDEVCQPSPPLSRYSFYCEEVVPPGGFGVYLDPKHTNQYTLFADYKSDMRNLVTGDEYKYEGTGNTDFLVQTIQLPDLVHIKDVRATLLFDRVDRACAPSDGIATTYFLGEAVILASPVSLTWSQPRGEMYVKYNSLVNEACPDYTISILLSHDRMDMCREIIINGTSGLIEEKANNGCTLNP